MLFVFLPKYGIKLNTDHEKMGKSIFQEKVFHHTLLRSSLPEDTLRSVACSTAQTPILKIRWFYTVSLMNKCLQSLLKRKLWQTPMTLKS